MNNEADANGSAADAAKLDDTSAAPKSDGLSAETPGKFLVTSARFVPPSTIAVEFADDYAADITTERDEMNIDGVVWTTLTVPPSRDGVVLRDTDDIEIPIIGVDVRYLADPEYQKVVDDRIQSLCLTREEMDEILPYSEPPEEWYLEDQTGLFR